MKRTLHLVTSALAALLLSTVAGWSKPHGGGGGGGGGNNTFSGQAVVVDATVLGINTVISDTGPLPSSGGALEASLLTVNMPGLVSANVAHAATVGQGDRSQSEASVADVILTVSGNTITAD